MGTKIRDLPDTATSVSGNDFFVVATSDNKTKKISATNLAGSLGGGGAGQFYIYTAAVGNGGSVSYQTYVGNPNSPKQAISAGVNYYMLPGLFNVGPGAMGGNQVSMLQVGTPSNMAATMTPSLSWTSANAKTFGAFIYQGHIYCFYTGRYGSLTGSPLALLQV